MTETVRPTWRKSSYSGGSNSNCVEAAVMDNSFAVRDSKDPSGPILQFTTQDWSAFVDGVKAITR